MLIRKMTPAECRAGLGQFRVGRLAFVCNGMPRVVPMRFSFDGSDLYGFSLLGEKIACMRENPHVCVEFDDQQNHFQWRSVVAAGRYEELPDSPENAMARRHAQEVLQKLPMWWQPATAVTEAQRDFVPILFCVRVTNMTGHEARPDPVEAHALSQSESAAVRSRAIRRFLGEVVHTSRKGAARPKH
jgi:uncharacterized protein